MPAAATAALPAAVVTVVPYIVAALATYLIPATALFGMQARERYTLDVEKMQTLSRETISRDRIKAVYSIPVSTVPAPVNRDIAAAYHLGTRIADKAMTCCWDTQRTRRGSVARENLAEQRGNAAQPPVTGPATLGVA